MTRTKKLYLCPLFRERKKEMYIHNFSAGPAILPEVVKKRVAHAVLDFQDTGLSLMEISHRSQEFAPIVEEGQKLVKELLNIPSGYHVLFLGGGASTQFYMLPYNLLREKAGYLNTGVWATKALKEAQLLGNVLEVASSADRNYCYIPEDYSIPPSLDYLHITTNNTIYGTQLHRLPNTSTRLCADMSSDIFSRPVKVEPFDVIYAGAQKNCGPAGVTLVIVREEALGKTSHVLPSMIDYRTHIKSGSMFNTPPVLPLFALVENLKWLKKQGGVEAIETMNQVKAQILYDEIDRNSLFQPTADPKHRSLMNICFVMKEGKESLETSFLAFARSQGMSGLKGHRSVGGFRASIYNAMPKKSIQALANCMKQFEEENR